MGLGVRPLLLTKICRDGEKHCCSSRTSKSGQEKNISSEALHNHNAHNTFFPIPLVGDGAGDTGTKSIRFGDDDEDFSKSLSL